ncbi:DUF5329 domain-containing protein [Thermomonas sp. RSS23]|jgi:hypothetical protein|uniref:DUF5329 domain-containing protein n=1 Tax=Thermomonas beijingensis TaxID=2872701 RepID=A0ABS7TH21_9GAMM|nr:DUF5329 domain-containing protein [Thermomonas beijingensis]MBZ4187147.1 DUF5329 domain-containing protein [Thermomonas beijingensis]
MKIKALLVASALLPLSALAQTPTSEIGQLFKALETSGCEFNRNGSWYNAQQASEHLHRKYDYLLKKGLVKSTESFIDLGASKSSMSGKAYLVRCGKAPAVESRSWFLAKLGQIRQASGRR